MSADRWAGMSEETLSFLAAPLTGKSSHFTDKLWRFKYRTRLITFLIKCMFAECLGAPCALASLTLSRSCECGKTYNDHTLSCLS